MSRAVSKEQPKAQRTADGSFDVVSVLGTVHIGQGFESPDLAAFRLIDKHDAPGEFTFPNTYGGTTRVNVEPPPRDDADDANDAI